jgi:hypothetical protein
MWTTPWQELSHGRAELVSGKFAIGMSGLGQKRLD